MKPETEKKIERTLKIVGLCVSCFALLTLIYWSYHLFSTGAFSLEFAMKKVVKDGEEYCTSKIINETTGVGFINYDCKPINQITKGIQRCKGQYYVFATRVNGAWIVNNYTKSIIW